MNRIAEEILNNNYYDPFQYLGIHGRPGHPDSLLARTLPQGFGAEQVETHHRGKQDRPSGTAAMLAACPAYALTPLAKLAGPDGGELLPKVADRAGITSAVSLP